MLFLSISASICTRGTPLSAATREWTPPSDRLLAGLFMPSFLPHHLQLFYSRFSELHSLPPSLSSGLPLSPLPFCCCGSGWTKVLQRFIYTYITCYRLSSRCLQFPLHIWLRFHLQLRLLAAISASGQRRATQNNNIQLNPFEPGTEEVGLCPRGPFRITNNLFILSFSPLLLPDESHCDNPCGGRLDVVAALPGGRWSTIDGPGGRCCCSRPLDCRRDLAGGRP